MAISCSVNAIEVAIEAGSQISHATSVYLIRALWTLGDDFPARLSGFGDVLR